MTDSRGDEHAEWADWEAADGILEMDDGRKVAVTHGDQVLIEHRGEAIAFVAHRPRTLN